MSLKSLRAFVIHGKCVFLMSWYDWREVRKCSSVSSVFCVQFWEHSLSSLGSQVCLWRPFSMARLCSLRLFTRSLTPSLPHFLTHSLTPSLSHSLTHSLPHSLTHSLTHSLPHSLTHSFTHSLPVRATHPVFLIVFLTVFLIPFLIIFLSTTYFGVFVMHMVFF